MLGIFQEPLALDVEIIECTRSGKRSTIACYAWVSGPPVSPSRVRPGNMAEKPARHTSLPTIAVLLESFAKWIPVRFHITYIPYICWEEGIWRQDDFIFFGSSKVYFCPPNMDSSKDSMKHEDFQARWWCMVRFTVFGACWRRAVRNARLKTGSNLLCFYTDLYSTDIQ